MMLPFVDVRWNALVIELVVISMLPSKVESAPVAIAPALETVRVKSSPDEAFKVSVPPPVCEMNESPAPVETCNVIGLPPLSIPNEFPLVPISPAVNVIITAPDVMEFPVVVVTVFAAFRSKVPLTVPELKLTPVALVLSMNALPVASTFMVPALVVNLVLPPTPMLPPVASRVRAVPPVLMPPVILPAVDTKFALWPALDPDVTSTLVPCAPKLPLIANAPEVVNAPVELRESD